MNQIVKPENTKSKIRTLIDHSAAGGPVLDVTEALNDAAPIFADFRAEEIALENKNQRPEPEGEEKDYCWEIPHQPRIQVSPNENTVRIWQEGQHGHGDNQEVEVALGNSIALARMILWAAGWESIGIYGYAKGGCFDLEDGMLAKSAKEDA